MNQLVKTVTHSELVDSFVRAMNGILNLTEREISLLVELIKIDMTAYENDEQFTVLTPSIRKVLAERLGISANMMSQHLKSLTAKNCIGKTSPDSWRVHKALIPNIVGNRVVQIQLVLKIGDENTDGILKS